MDVLELPQKFLESQIYKLVIYLEILVWECFLSAIYDFSWKHNLF